MKSHIVSGDANATNAKAEFTGVSSSKILQCLFCEALCDLSVFSGPRHETYNRLV